MRRLRGAGGDQVPSVPDSCRGAAPTSPSWRLPGGEAEPVRRCPTAQSPAISAPAQPQHAARPPAGRPAPQPAPCRPRLRAWAPTGFGPPSARGPGPASSNRHPEDAQAALGPRRPGGLGREAQPSPEPQGSGLSRRLRLSGPPPPPCCGTPGPGCSRASPRAREREAWESAPGMGAGGGRAARDPSRSSPLAPSALPRSCPRAARWGRAGPGRGRRCLLRERRLALRATSEASLPPVWRRLVTQVD
ncbi:basic proline-rich protein-like [Choloepus didactylus]|uniref:basic proline-rich protein-like n=1 Tax=Choloepus didactylus TaxID=27675 RepID=UPI00189E6ED6|nr:basic proline-rich protein-like [Choloepus didactylus]